MPSLVQTICVTTVIAFACASTEFVRADSDPYLEAGVPATNRVWSGPDYARTAEVLASGSVGLPMYEDAAGKAVLDRLTSFENFALAKNTTIDVVARINDTNQMLTGANSLLKQYLAVANR